MNAQPEKNDPVSQPITQEEKGFRKNYSAWIRQLPRLNFPPPVENYQLIDPKRLDEILKGTDPEAAQRIREDIAFMDYELLRLFRNRDHAASLQQNRYRTYQIMFMVLAAFATLLGSIQALLIQDNPDSASVIAFGETLVALAATYLATISGREPPLPLWLQNRRRAEQLRREYFRFLLDLPPYDTANGFQRQQLLSRRAADINRGVNPDVDRQS